MAVRLKKQDVERLAPQIERLILEGRSKEDICKELDIFKGAVNMYLRNHASADIREKALTNGQN
jgi:predicted transcriptional regulator